MLSIPSRSLVEGELKTADLPSWPVATLLSIAAKLAVILSAKAVFLWGLKKATLHKSTFIHVEVRSRKQYLSHLFDSQAADIVLDGNHDLEDYMEGDGWYRKQDDYVEEDYKDYAYCGIITHRHREARKQG